MFVGSKHFYEEKEKKRHWKIKEKKNTREGRIGRIWGSSSGNSMISMISLFCVWNWRVRFSVRLSEIAPAIIALLLLNLPHNMQHLSDSL